MLYFDGDLFNAIQAPLFAKAHQEGRLAADFVISKYLMMSPHDDVINLSKMSLFPSAVLVQWICSHKYRCLGAETKVIYIVEIRPRGLRGSDDHQRHQVLDA
jgi:hypothetical protein